MMIDTGRAAFQRPFQFREFLDQTWMIARVSLVPTLLVSIPFTVLVAFTLNILLREIGAADLSGAGTAFGTITQLGPVVTVPVVAGAGATAICADLGARTIREEIDAMRVLGLTIAGSSRRAPMRRSSRRPRSARWSCRPTSSAWES
jgi:phospholipid/cholesterol/gamma-HCH transport system permease protein